MKTVLKAEMLAAMPAMNDASRPVIARPSRPLGSTSRISSRIALLYSNSGSPVSLRVGHLGDQDAGDHAGNDHEEGDEHLREGADDRRLAGRRHRVGGHRPLHLDEVGRPVAEGEHEAEAEDDARRPTAPGSRSPTAACPATTSADSAGSVPACTARSVIWSLSPPQPPTRCRPIRVSGSSAATMTKNCSTSL